MNDDNTKWVKDWVTSYNDREDRNAQLTPREVEKAAIIGNAVFQGNVGVGTAAKAGIDAVRKLRE